MHLQWTQTIKFSLKEKKKNQNQINSRYLATEQVMYWESLFLLSLLFLENGAELITLSDTLFQWTDLLEMSCDTEKWDIIFIKKKLSLKLFKQ